MNVIEESEVQFYRPDEGTGSYNNAGEWIQDKSPFKAKGSLQPYKQGEKQLTLPTGVLSNAARVFYTRTEIRTAEQFGNTNADEAVINGFAYTAMASEDWSSSLLSLSHYEVLLVRRDKNEGI